MIKSRWVGPVAAEDPWADRGPGPWRSPLDEGPSEVPTVEASPGGGNGGR